MKDQCGTPAYISPEILNNQVIDNLQRDTKDFQLIYGLLEVLEMNKDSRTLCNVIWNSAFQGKQHV
jgi:hypothetical protein